MRGVTVRILGGLYDGREGHLGGRYVDPYGKVRWNVHVAPGILLGLTPDRFVKL